MPTIQNPSACSGKSNPNASRANACASGARRVRPRAVSAAPAGETTKRARAVPKESIICNESSTAPSIAERRQVNRSRTRESPTTAEIRPPILKIDVSRDNAKSACLGAQAKSASGASAAASQRARDLNARRQTLNGFLQDFVVGVAGARLAPHLRRVLFASGNPKRLAQMSVNLRRLRMARRFR